MNDSGNSQSLTTFKKYLNSRSTCINMYPQFVITKYHFIFKHTKQVDTEQFKWFTTVSFNINNSLYSQMIPAKRCHAIRTVNFRYINCHNKTICELYKQYRLFNGGPSNLETINLLPKPPERSTSLWLWMRGHPTPSFILYHTHHIAIHHYQLYAFKFRHIFPLS